jgi:hypothetical protein
MDVFTWSKKRGASGARRPPRAPTTPIRSFRLTTRTGAASDSLGWAIVAFDVALGAALVAGGLGDGWRRVRRRRLIAKQVPIKSDALNLLAIDP